MLSIINEKKVYIYGLSTETERILKEWDGKYKVVGLLDGFRTEGYQYGYPILNIEEIIKEENIIIIVVARPGSCKAIAKRIGNICRENNVLLYDIRGKDLLVENKIIYDFASISGYTRTQLLEKANNYPAISFDLFDTLVVRNTLSSDDVVALVSYRLEEKGIYISDFVNKRISIEKKSSKTGAPRLEKIYSELLDYENDVKIRASDLAKLEFDIDSSLLIPREEMLDIINVLHDAGKKIYITSESYYSYDQIKQILEENNIQNIEDIIVSCEYNTNKTGELFLCLKEIAKTDDVLHIGDDVVADVESAIRYGVNAFHIYSASELLDILGGLGLLNESMTISDKIRVGMFIAKLFNSPFQFEGDNKHICVNTADMIGYLFFSAMIFDFTYWFGNKAKACQVQNTWFSARDGYLIQKIYEILFPNSNSEYFLTSRTAAIRAGVSNEKDIEYVDGMKYSGTIQDCLMTRFNILESEIDKKDIKENEEGLKKYCTHILKTAEQKRENYCKYIASLEVKSGYIAFFDFVAKGTSQMYINRLISNKLKGFYFLQLEPDFMKDKDLDIESFYNEDERANSAIFDDYYILETILTSYHPSVNEFDIMGNPIYAKETRKEKDIQCIKEVHKGIIDYINVYMNICPFNMININKQLDEIMLRMIHNIDICNNNFMELVVEDPFFKRMTNLCDIL